MDNQQEVEQILNRAKFLKKLRAPLWEAHPNQRHLQAELETLVGQTEASRLLTETLND